MELTFAEAAKGVTKELSVNLEDACPRCDGKGSEPGTKVPPCHYCNGTGMVGFRRLYLYVASSSSRCIIVHVALRRSRSTRVLS